MNDFRIRCSAIGKLMTEPTAAAAKAGEVLSVGAKTAIRELLAQDLFGVEFEVSSKPMEKGIECEPAAIELLNRVRGLALTKNTERRTNAYITGECDLYDAPRRAGRDLKCAWSVATFPICPEDIASTQRTLYEWQMRGYMWLWDADEWHVDYCLVDTPDRLIGFEPITLHVVSHIPEHMRVTTWTVKRDRAKEDQMAAKVRAARDYYAEAAREFDATHRAPAALMAA
jgi:hypothetical protein